MRSRIVIIRGYAEPEEFLAAGKRQSEKLKIQGIVTILSCKRLTVE
ncbi:hypothetical protein [Desmonostoc muscorum]